MNFFRTQRINMIPLASDKTVRIWDAETGDLCKTLNGHTLGVSDVTWSPDSAYLASASDDKNIILWDSTTGEPLKTFRGHTNYVFSLKFNRQSSLLVSGSYDESVRLWDIKSGACILTIPAHSDPVTTVDFRQDMLISGSFDGVIRIWDWKNGTCTKTLTSEDNHPVSFVCFSGNAKYLLASTLDDSMNLWLIDGDKPKKLKSYTGHVNKKFCLFSSFWNRTYIITGSEDNSVFIWHMNSQALFQKIENAHAGPVIGVSVHPSQKN